MEVNINNSFPLAMRLTWYPFIDRCNNILSLLDNEILSITVLFLQNPLLTTLIISTLFFGIVALIAYSFIVLLGVFFFTSVILMAEGFAVVILLTALCIFSVIPIFILTLIVTLFISLKDN